MTKHTAPMPEEKIWEALGWPQDVAPNSMYLSAFPQLVKLVRAVEEYHFQKDEHAS